MSMMMTVVAIITDAVIIDAGTESAGVALGSTVTVLYDGDDEPERLLLGSVEERTGGLMIVSPGSPMGKALLGAGAGDQVEFETPGGTTEKVIVVEVS